MGYIIISKVSALVALSYNSRKNKEYLIGKKSLNAAYKLCKGYFMKSFCEIEYYDYKQKLNEKIKQSCCERCGKYRNEGGIKLKACKGCMNTFYCNKYCQKRHWKLHKDECNKTWINLYPALKVCIFDPLIS